jgi:hypothetical protein
MWHSQTLFRPLVLTVSILIGMGCLAGCQKATLTGSNQDSPEDALKRFYDNDGPEDTLMDPLILAGDRVVPFVLKEIKNKEMRRRRYAIGFLGNGSYKDALPVLEPILQDSSEEDFFRGDALQSIYMIDESRGRQLAENYKQQEDYLGQISQRVINGDSQLKKRRTYSDALSGKHE